MEIEDVLGYVTLLPTLQNIKLKMLTVKPNWSDRTIHIEKRSLLNICKEVPKKGKHIEDKNKILAICIRLPYIWNNNGLEELLKQCIREVKRNCTTDIKFVILCQTKKISYCCTVKNKIPIEQRFSVICQITCPGCFKHYVRKTDPWFYIRMNEHGRKPDQLMKRHLKNKIFRIFLSRIGSTFLCVMWWRNCWYRYKGIFD